MGQRGYTQDAELILRIAGAKTASGAAVDASDVAIVKNVGQARFEGVLVTDVRSLAIDGNDERYDILVQGSSVEAFTAGTIQNLAILELGATEVRKGAAIDSTVGRYETPFTNEADGVVYPYIRIYDLHTGATSSLSHESWVGIKY